MGEELINLYSTNVTNIPNAFLEKYLADVNPEFLKVYLYYLWKQNENINVEDVANELNLTVNDVERAVKYWAKQKKLISVDNKSNIKKQTKEELVTEEKTTTKNNKNKEFEENQDEIYTIEADFLKNKKNKFETNESEYNELLLYAGQILPNISNLQVNLLRKLYYEDGMPLDVIEYLIEYCAELGKVNTRYMSSVATSWYENGYKTVKDVKNSEEQYKNLKSKKTKSTKRKSQAVANKREDDYYEKLFIENSMKKGLKS